MLQIYVAEAPAKSALTEEADLLELPLKMFLLNPAKPIAFLIHLKTTELEIP